MAKRRVRAKDIKKQRWAGIVAAVLALGMLVSLAGVYIGQSILGSENDLPGPQEELQPEDYLTYYQGEVDRLELYIQQHEADEAVLLELVENYRYLSFIQQVFFDNQDLTEEYDLRMVSLYKSLIELEPLNLRYRLELINLYLEKYDNRDLVNKEIADLKELLRVNPDPLVHLSLIHVLSSTGQEELALEEISWLHQYLEVRVDQGLSDNEELFYYAVLLGEYIYDVTAAEEILMDIIDKEDENSIVYQDAKHYLDYLRSENNQN